MPKLKRDAQGNVVVEGEKPVYVLDDGTEQSYDLPGLHRAIGATREERDAANTRADAAEGKLKAFQTAVGDVDLEKVKDALQVRKNLDDKKLVDAGKVDELVNSRLAEATKAWGTEKTGFEEKVKGLGARISQLTVGAKFAASKAAGVLKDTTLPLDAAMALWGSAFEPGASGDDVTAVRVGPDGKKATVYSTTDPSKPASFEEHLKALIDAHPERAAFVLKAAPTGTGANQTTTNNTSTKSMPRAAFDALPHDKRAAFMKEGGALT
jgi:hypothetical protein